MSTSLPQSDDKIKILLVDDEPANLLALEAILDPLGETLVRARSGEEALRLTADEDYAVVLLDVLMPGFDGFATAKIIRGRPRSQQTPLIFLTAYESDRFPVVEAYKLGAVDYLVKPIVPEILFAKVAVFVDLFRKTRLAQRQVEELQARDLRDVERQRMAKALRESESRHRQLADNLPAGFIYQIMENAEGKSRFSYVSGGVENLFGVTPTEIAANPLILYQMILPEDLPRMREQEDESRRQRLPFDCQFRVKARDGCVRWIHCRSAPRVNPEGGNVWDGIAVDITDRVEASNALKRSEARYRALVEAITQAVWSWSPHTAQGDYARNLQWWEKITGQTPQEQRDDPHRWLSVVHPDDRARAAAVWTEARQSGNCYDVEYRVKSPSGDYRHIHARGVAIFGSQGTVEEWVGTLDDVTEQRHAQQQLHDNEERLRAAFSAARMVGWTYDPHTNRMNRSENVQELFGYVPEPTPEAGWACIVPEDLEQHKQTVRTALAQDLGYKSQYRVIRPDTGELRWFEDHARGERDASGRLVRVAGVIIDITDRKRAEEALRASEESLRDANRRKDDFLAMLAHELRNPLAPIRTSLHILGLGGCDAKTADNVRTMMERQVQHLARIVDDLLDVSRITRGKITLRKSPVDLARFVRVSADDHRRAFDARKVQLLLSVPPQPIWVSADSTRLAQILDNLLTNALKFTNEGGKVEVKATVDEEANLAFLSVRDSGVGIEPEVLPHLFGAFTQADQSLDRSQGGLGLGLAIVKGLVEMHGGTVRAESPGVGQGATFTISLRLDRESPLLVDGPVAKLCSMQRLRILVVEDNRDTAESLRLLLELSGYQVTIAHSGVEGVEAARRTQPEVVLCDLGLPGMDGFAVARALRGQSERTTAKLIAVTGYGREEDRLRAIEAGFDLHLTKPVDPQKLLAELVKM